MILYHFAQSAPLIPIVFSTCGGLDILSPPSSPHLEERSLETTFVPTEARVTPQDSVLLSIADIPMYLDKVLKTLSLHTEARTSFITSVPRVSLHRPHATDR